MNQILKLKNLNNLSYFDKNTLSQFFNLSDNSLYANIKRWLKGGDLVQLKKGLYVTNEYLIKTDIESYREFIANKLREPSYLSLEYVLQKHSILTEAIYAYTSITLKSKRSYKNKLGNFLYRSISKSYFNGFEIKTLGKYEIKEATKAKALFDYLYLKTYRLKSISAQYLLSLRLNLDDFNDNDIEEFSKYCAASSANKFKKLLVLLRRIRDS